MESENKVESMSKEYSFKVMDKWLRDKTSLSGKDFVMAKLERTRIDLHWKAGFKAAIEIVMSGKYINSEEMLKDLYGEI